MKSLHSAMLCKSISNRVSLHKIKFYIIMCAIYCIDVCKFTSLNYLYMDIGSQAAPDTKSCPSSSSEHAHASKCVENRNK